MSDAPPRIRFDRISKRFPGVQALDAVSFDVGPGSVHAVVGENGAGKSTLIRILAGAVRADSGRIRLDGQCESIRDARHAQALGIATVYQEMNLAADISVAENVYLGRWPRLHRSPLIDFDKLYADAGRLFDSIGVRVPVRAAVGRLGVAQQQMVEIAKALSLKARVLVLDEPSAVLTPNELEGLFALVRRLTAAGVSVIYISHRLDEIFALADAVTVLRDGRHISTRPLGEVSRQALIAECVGRPMQDEFPSRQVEIGERVLRVSGLTALPAFRDISFEIRAGEVFGLTGLIGSGRSSLARAIFGARRVDAGVVDVAGQSGPFTSPRRAKRAGIALLPEDRKREGLLLARPLRENLTLGHLDRVARYGLIRRGTERQAAAGLMARHGVRAAGTEVPTATLSGGNQQKLMLARWLQRPYRVIILDEPTRGVDVGAKFEIHERLAAMAAGGAAVLLISSELPEIIGMADRIGVMCDGRLAGVLDNDQRGVSQEQIMRLAVGER